MVAGFLTCRFSSFMFRVSSSRPALNTACAVSECIMLLVLCSVSMNCCCLSCLWKISSFWKELKSLHIHREGSNTEGIPVCHRQCVQIAPGLVMRQE